MYASQLGQGENYSLLEPAYSVVWAVPRLFPQLRELHTLFALCSPQSCVVLSDHIQLHVLQLANDARREERFG